MLYKGLIIDAHCVKDAASKDAATKSLTGWQQKEQAPEAWMHELELGKTIVLAEMKQNEDGTYSHVEKNFIRTWFVLADADNFKGVEFLPEGIDKNPDGIEFWTERDGLSKRYPDLLNTVYAVQESVSSMQTEIPHKRYRLIFQLNAPIETVAHYRFVLSELQKQFAVISPTKRQPAQPVFGSARENGKVAILENNILDIADFELIPEPTSPAPHTYPSKSLLAFLLEHGIDHEVRDKGGFFVKCPFSQGHTGAKQGDTDSYVWEGENGWAFYCSHAHCRQNRTWKRFKEGHGIETKPYVTDPPPLTSEIDTEISEQAAPQFPDQLFVGYFKMFHDAFKGAYPISPASLFAASKHVVSAILGKSVWIASGKRGLNANTYSCIVGDSSLAHKSVTCGILKDILRTVDPLIYQTTNLATPEGLLNLFVPPVFHEEDNLYKGGYAGLIEQELIGQIMEEQHERESNRVTGVFSELSAQFRASSKTTGSGLIEKLLELYDCEPQIDSPTKASPTIAYNPTWTLFSASTMQQIEYSLDKLYVTSGLTNRFEWYLAENMETMYLFGEPESTLYEKVLDDLRHIRKAWRGTRWTFAPEAAEFGLSWLRDYEADSILNEPRELVKNSVSRGKSHQMKNALLFGILENADPVISLEQAQRAAALTDYLKETVRFLFGLYESTETHRVENRIIAILKEKPNQSVRSIQNKMVWANVEQIQRSLETLIKAQMVGTHAPKRTQVYYVVKEEKI